MRFGDLNAATVGTINRIINNMDVIYLFICYSHCNNLCPIGKDYFWRGSHAGGLRFIHDAANAWDYCRG